MSLPDHQLELLAPARDVAIGIQAINHGADAVYIGGPAFGARINAGNALRDLEALCRHAHKFHARIFITLNTILRDDELEDARRMAWQVYETGADALIIQDMGLLELDLPPLELHASTQCDIRTPEKARFLQDAGFSQLVLARELTLPQIAAIRAVTDTRRCALEFFVHGALCVAYSGQCWISHAHTGRSANRGDCSQACRLPYHVVDERGRFVAHGQHVLSLKDNNQSANLPALVDAGVRSFKIEGRYKDMGYVKNITAHYRLLLDALLEERAGGTAPLARASSGRCTFTFTPDPQQNFNREFTDGFIRGRQPDMVALDSPKNSGRLIGQVAQVGRQWIDIDVADVATVLHNGDGLCYFDLQKELVGLPVNRTEPAPQQPEDGAARRWRVYPREPVDSLRDLRSGTPVNRNRDMDWVRKLEKPSAQRRIALRMQLAETADGFALTLTDEDDCSATASILAAKQPAHDEAGAMQSIRAQLARLGATHFMVGDVQSDITLCFSRSWFVAASALNQLRRAAVEALVAERVRAYKPVRRAAAVEPPVPYPQRHLGYLANVYNHSARDFYARHGVQVIEAAYESHEELGEVSLMITKYCVRHAMSLCPRQARGVQGVQGTVRAQPLQLINGSERLTLRFDCKPCEMHVMGRIKRSVLKASAAQPVRVYRRKPETEKR